MITFVNVRTEKDDTERETFFRQEIWIWIESSLARGNYKWVVRNVSPTYDIHALYTKVCSLANKATFISHALEVKQIFTINPGNDIFLYHAELLEQMRLVKSQGESLGLSASIPPWLEQSLLLILIFHKSNTGIGLCVGLHFLAHALLVTIFLAVVTLALEFALRGHMRRRTTLEALLVLRSR